MQVGLVGTGIVGLNVARELCGLDSSLRVALLSGTPARRAVSYAGLTLFGAALIVLGTLVAPYPWAAVVTTFAVGATATFSGVLSSSAAAATSSA